MYQILYNIKSSKVIQWQDTSKLNYVVPDDSNYHILEIDKIMFDNRSDDNWYVVDGSLTNIAPKKLNKWGIISNIWNFLTKRT